jgi:hypothetical protein
VTTVPTGLGRVVADGNGRTLYLFENDTTTRSACSGTCAVYWPPLLTRGAFAHRPGRIGRRTGCDPPRCRSSTKVHNTRTDEPNSPYLGRAESTSPIVRGRNCSMDWTA